jgi:hypothetical protein
MDKKKIWSNIESILLIILIIVCYYKYGEYRDLKGEFKICKQMDGVLLENLTCISKIEYERINSINNNHNFPNVNTNLKFPIKSAG